MMLRELGGALESMADGPHDERRNSLELLNNILEVLSRHNVVRRSAAKSSSAHTAFWVIASQGTEGAEHTLAVSPIGHHVGSKIA